MTTKGPSRKQVIIPMSNNNNNSFIKNSATHVTNINRLLRNAKSEVAVDFIRSNPICLVIVTNKVAIQSDLQIIGQYIKKSEDINELQVEEPCLSQDHWYPLLPKWQDSGVPQRQQCQNYPEAKPDF